MLRASAVAFVLAALLAPGPAFADSRAALACAARLNAEAKTIYDAAAGEFATAPDPRAMLKATVMSLVQANKVQVETARTSATAAGECLKELR
jgi:hypothetical protein